MSVAKFWFTSPTLIENPGAYTVYEHERSSLTRHSLGWVFPLYPMSSGGGGHAGAVAVVV